MKVTRRQCAAGIAAAAIMLSPVVSAPAALAAEGDISVVYSTGYNGNAPIDGSYTAYARVGEDRNDLQVSYTISTDNVHFPYPAIEYTGDFDVTNSDEVTYSFKFSALPGSPAEAYQYQIDNMNNWIADPANHMTGRSIATFTDDVKPLIQAFGMPAPNHVPQGVIGTVTVHLNSSKPGTGQLRFWLYEGGPNASATGEALSPVAISPLVVTMPELNANPVNPFCEAFTEYTTGDTKYTPTNFGRTSFDLDATVTSLGDTQHYTQDKPGPFIVDNDANIKYGLSSGESDLNQAAAKAALLAKGAGSYDVTASYEAEDGYRATPIETTVTVLPKDDSRCVTTSKVPSNPTASPTPTTPTTPSASPSVTPTAPTTPTTELPATGADPARTAALGITLVSIGIGLVVLRRRTTE